MNKTLLRFIPAAAWLALPATTTADDDAPGDSPVTFWAGVEHWDFGETGVPLVESWDHKLTSTQLGIMRMSPTLG